MNFKPYKTDVMQIQFFNLCFLIGSDVNKDLTEVKPIRTFPGDDSLYPDEWLRIMRQPVIRPVFGKKTDYLRFRLLFFLHEPHPNGCFVFRELSFKG